MARNRVLVGVQWGDEGKGAEGDRMSQDPDVDIVIRYGGGNNAGHRVKVNGQTFDLHQVPVGVIFGKIVLLGNGMAINPIELVFDEIQKLRDAGVNVSSILISDRASLVMPWHIEEDRLREESSDGPNKIGTTKRGIGQCYRDDADRIGLRANILAFSQDRFESVVEAKLEEAVKSIKALYPSFDVESFVAKFPWQDLENARLYLAPLIIDLPSYVWKAIEEGNGILAEGAQGAMLDLRLGTYPFVTSSHPTIAGALDGCSLSAKDITDVFGISKAYTTRVGLGPFPTRMAPVVEEGIREKGAEFGTTTGRGRNCGWLDLVQLKYACRLNGVDALTITKIDVLSGLEKIQICVAYRLNGRIIDYVPADLGQVEPIYETVDGWEEDLANCQKFEDLPLNCQAYIRKIETIGVPVKRISKGPERADVIVLAA
ncbi:MAG: adenylosuccinate synthase [bacterium]|nr:adenylosuccinate synthase [bacterium]